MIRFLVFSTLTCIHTSSKKPGTGFVGETVEKSRKPLQQWNMNMKLCSQSPQGQFEGLIITPQEGSWDLSTNQGSFKSTHLALGILLGAIYRAWRWLLARTLVQPAMSRRNCWGKEEKLATPPISHSPHFLLPSFICRKQRGPREEKGWPKKHRTRCCQRHTFSLQYVQHLNKSSFLQPELGKFCPCLVHSYAIR